MKKFLLIATLCAAVYWLVPPTFADVTGRPHDLNLSNPKGHCINCHDLHQTKLGQGFSHNLKRANEIAVCYQCHAGALNNYSSIDPSFKNITGLYSHYDIRSEFNQPHIHFPRYGMDGEHNKCSFCHNPHGVFNSNSTIRKPKLLSAGPDAVTDTDDFCLVCHNNDPNPPHQKFSNISVGAQYRFSRNNYKQMKHSTFYRWSTANEPVPDTARTYDDNPYGKGKDISCLTCHRPHGSPNNYMLKLPDDQGLCLTCHNGGVVFGIQMPDLSQFNATGHGKTGVGRTCQECHFPHGTGQKNAVKTLIQDPHTLRNMTANVNGKGMNEVCFACHSQGSAATAYYSFDSSIAGWYNYFALTQTRDTTKFYSGGGSFKQTASSPYPYNYSYCDLISVQPGTAYNFYGALYIPATITGGAVYVQIEEINAAGNDAAMTTSAQWSVATGMWNKRIVSFTTNPSTNRVRIRLFLTGTGTAYWDEISILGPSDGTSYPGKANYSLSIHKTSPNALNPNDTTGDQAGDCGNCHNPHGKGNLKMLVEPDDQTMCYDCHNSSTPNTQSGADVNAAFQSASHHNLTQVKCTNCHNAHTATQSSPTRDPYYPGGVVTDKTGFCLSCHSGSMPAGVTGAPDISAEWGGGGHNKTQTLICSDCHESHGSPNGKTINYKPKTSGGYTANFAPGMSFASRSFCEACHNRTGTGYKGAKMIPTGAGYVGQHVQADPTPCSNCHSRKHNPTLSSYTGASSFYSTACLTCHTQGTGNPYPNVNAEFNTPANATDAGTRTSMHALTYNPPSTNDCTVCHGTHSNLSAANDVVDPDPAHPTAQSLNPNVSNAFCLQCHDATPVSIGGMTPPNILDTYTSAGHGKATANILCGQCHEHHGSVYRKLIKTTINGSNVMSVYSGDNVSVCTACHKSKASAIPAWPGYSVYSGSIHAFGNLTTGNTVTDDRHGRGACVNCHNPHGARVAGNTAPSMLYKKGENLCYRCHASGFDNFSTPGDYNNKWYQFGTFLRIAKENDAAQTSRNRMALHFGQTGGQNVPALNGGTFDEGLSSNAFPDKDAVITVKVKIPVMNQSAGYVMPGSVTVEDAADMPLPWPDTYIPPNVFCTFYGGTWLVWAVAGNPPDNVFVNSVPGFGNEATTYHTMKFVRTKALNQLAVYIDSTFIGNAPFTPTSGYFKVRLEAYGSTAGPTSAVEAWFDDFNVQYTSGGSAHNTSSGDDVQARFYMKSHHKISDSDQVDGSKVECTDCHDPHTITEKLMGYQNTSGVSGRSVQAVVADQNFCLKCHSASPPAGIKFPAGGVWDKSAYDSSAHGNPLKRYKTLQPGQTFLNYSNGTTYACKVCHNPHGSNQVALERESWDINRDGIPDDINGDGILDSSSQVGFIGYSTDQSGNIVRPRKVILVGKMAGMPSRSTFKRISTTIPVQANGAIDVMLCLNCHDGKPAPDVKSEFAKVSHHDVTFADQTAHGGSKIECYNCHDQHRAQARNDAAGEYPTTNPTGFREPMAGDAAFCLKCHNNNPPPTVSFGSLQLKNVKLSYNPGNLLNAKGYDIITSYQGHFVQATGKALMCRECHNQHGSNYKKMLRDDTEPSKPGYDSTQPVQNMQPVALRPSDPFSGGDNTPLSSTPERCLACHSGGATFEGRLLPIPPPPDSAERGFTLSPVGKHPDLKPEVTSADETGGHIYRSTFAVITTPGSVKETCTQCHDSHSPYIPTVNGQLMDCYRCHNQNTSLPDVQTEFNDNPTNPTRSQSIHPIKYDPTGTTPYYVECLKCHDQTKHMQGRVRLRKVPNQFINYTSDKMVWTTQPTTGGNIDSTLRFTNNSTINQFCLECHGPRTTVASSFWRGGTEHVPPKLPAGHLSGAHFVNGSLLCTDCHEYHGSRNKGLRKNARGDEETFCYSCHSSPANSLNGINIQAKFAATSHHQVAQADQTANRSKVECEDCHNPHVVTRTSPVVRMPNVTTASQSDSAFCIGCHNSSGAPGVRFPGYTTGVSAPEWNTATGKWNKWDKSAYTGSDHDAKGGLLCKKCHDPHGSPNYALLLQNISSTSNISVGFGVHSTTRGKRKEELGVNGVCASCHKKPVGVYNFANYSVGSYPGYASFTGLTFGRKNGVDKNCTYCHNPHGTAQPKLIRSNKPLYMNMTSNGFGGVYNFKGFQNSTTGGPYYSFCSSRGCHASERTQIDTFNQDLPVDNFTRDETASSHHPLKEGVIGCTSCHGEHGTPNAPDVRAPYFREKNWPTLLHGGRGVYSTYHRPGEGDPFDGSNYYELSPSPSGWPPDATHRNQVTTVNPPDNANDLCFMCHQRDDIIGTAANGMTGTNTKFLGHEAVKGGAMMSHRISRDTAIPANGEYHNFSCSMCHFPHSSPRGKLLKTGCLSQADNTQDPNYTYGTINACHSYKKVWYGGAYRGWRNLTTAGKSDFRRPPNAVTNLTVSSDPDLTVHLYWSAVADAPGQGAHHYNVYRYSQAVTQASKPYATRISNRTVMGGSPGTAMTYADLTGQPNTTYYYAVVACDSENNESFVSNSPQVSLGADTFPPNAISGQTTGQVDGTYNVKLTWNDPGDNVNVTTYKVYRKAGLTALADSDITSGNYLASVPDTSLSADGSGYPIDATTYSYTDTTAQFGSGYSYAVVALDAAGNVSHVPTGTAFSVTIVDPPPAAVTTLTARPVSLQMQAQLNWTAPVNVGAISGYRVYRKPGSAPTQSDLVSGNRVADSLTGLSYIDNVPSAATDYYYAVTAVDQSSGKESQLGNSVSVNIPAPPSAVSAAMQKNSVIQVGWTAPAYTTGFAFYKVYTQRGTGSWTQAALVDNLVPNPGFENDLSSWAASSLTAVRDTANYYDGVASVKLIGTSAGDKFLQANVVAVLPSTVYTYSGYVYVPVALTSGSTALKVIEYNSSGYVTEHTATGVTATSGWQKLTDTWTTASATTQVYLKLELSGVGTANWDGLSLTSPVTGGTSAKVSLSGLEPGSYSIAVTADYGTYAGVAPYESVLSAPAVLNVTDTAPPASIAVTGALTQTSGYNNVRLNWTSPADQNYSGYTPSGMAYYIIRASYDQGVTWGTILRTRLLNPSFESFTGTVDDANTDTFGNWSQNATNTYAVSDSFCDGTAIRISYTGSGDDYITSAEPDTGHSVASKTYSMSFWAKANKSTTFQYFIQANGGNYEWIGTTSPAIGTGWQFFTASGTFTSAATATSARVVIRPSADTTAQINIDAVRLLSGTDALFVNDGSYVQPAGYGSPGSAQSFDDPNALAAGTAARYIVQAYDTQNNLASVMTDYVSARPAPVTDLTVTSSATTSANVLTFTTPNSAAGISGYMVYAKEQASPLSSVTGATLLTPTPMTPNLTSGGNIALRQTTVSTANYANKPAGFANDGNASTYWEGSSGATNLLTLDLGSTISVGSVSLAFDGLWYLQPSNYTVQTSNDNTNWTTQVTVTGNTSQYPAYTFAAPRARYIRLSITDLRGGIAYYNPRVYEFGVYPGMNEQYIHDSQNLALPALVGHTYSYAVIPVDTKGFSSDISGGPTTYLAVRDKDAPQKVTDLAVTSPVGTNKAILSWSTPPDNDGLGTGTGATRYEVYRAPLGVTDTAVPVTDDNFSDISKTQLCYSGTYKSSQAGTFNNYTATWYDHSPAYYGVRSVDSAGNWSPMSNSPYVIVGKDTQAPSPPTIWSCAPAASPEVDVKWYPAVDNIGINGYMLFRADTGTEPFATDKCITENNINLAATVYSQIPYNYTVISDTAGVPGKTYYYAMRAYDDEGNISNISNCATATVATTAADTTAPTWSGTPLTVFQQPWPDMDLIWTAAADLDNSGASGTIDHYDIYRSSSSFSSATDTGVTKIATVSGLKTSYIDNTGDHGTYYYAVIAVDASASHNQSAISNVVSGTYAAKPAPDNTPPTIPAGLSASTGIYPFINLAWTASTDVDDLSASQQLMCYRLYRSDYPLDITDANKGNTALVKTFIIANNAESYAATGTGGATYNYRIEAFDLAGNRSGLSNQVTSTVAPAPCVDTTPPSEPSGLVLRVGPSPDMELAWGPSADSGCPNVSVIDHYNLYRANYAITASTDLRTITPVRISGDIAAYTNLAVNGGFETSTTGWTPAGVTAAINTSVVYRGAGSVKLTGTTDGNKYLESSDFVTVQPSTSYTYIGYIDIPMTLTGVSPTAALKVEEYDGTGALVSEQTSSAVSSTSGWTKLAGSWITGPSTVKVKLRLQLTGIGTAYWDEICLVASRTYTDSAGAPNTQYWYAMTAVDPSGNESGISNIAVNTTAADTMPPASIADLKATPASGKMALTWCRPSDNVGVDHFDIYRKEQGTIMTDADITPANKIATFVNGGVCLSYNDAGVVSGHTYSYAVIAVDAAGNRSTISKGQAAGDTIAAMP